MLASFFDESVNELNVDKKKVLLVVTDAAPYMYCAINGLQLLYSKMIHLTCTAHDVHRVVECIREEFDDVNKLISNVIQIFTKTASRRLHVFLGSPNNRNGPKNYQIYHRGHSFPENSTMSSSVTKNEIIRSLSRTEMNAFNFASMTSCDVERTFSAYKRVLEDSRCSFLFDNLKSI